MKIPFNRPYLTGKEIENILVAHDAAHLSGDGQFTRACHEWLRHHLDVPHAFLTHSCTAALEMAALLASIQPGDEVILPSYTFVSTANAFVLRGAVPVFVDVRQDTFNIDETLVERAMSSKTKAIVPVHYAGVPCDVDALNALAGERCVVIEDAAQAIGSTLAGRPAGSLGALGALSFHETKNVISGEGGALLVKDESLAERAEIIREKGTNRSRFFRGQVDKYTWVDVGSSFLPSELNAAFLMAQLDSFDGIQARRMALWERYHAAFADLEAREKIRRPIIPSNVRHNAHMYYLLLPNLRIRTEFMAFLKDRGINTVFHYVPLHSSPHGSRVGRVSGSMRVTEEVSDRLVRLPLWVGLEPALDEVVEAVQLFFRSGPGADR